MKSLEYKSYPKSHSLNFIIAFLSEIQKIYWNLHRRLTDDNEVYQYCIKEENVLIILKTVWNQVISI